MELNGLEQVDDFGEQANAYHWRDLLKLQKIISYYKTGAGR